tara:strand:+ start:3622 stop:4749 length:1128 start_codon:yes stop_codon:yes gene_type:complete
MKIAINCRLLLKDKLEGIGWYTYEISKRIAENHPEHVFYFLFDRPFSEEFIFGDNVKPVILSPQSRHPFLWYIWFEYSVSRFIKKSKIDLFFSPDGYLSLNTNTKTILTIHDLNFEHYPDQLPFLTRNYYKFFTPKFCKKADAIITVSEESKKDIIKQYNTAENKITKVYNGANPMYKPLNNIQKQEIRNRYANGSKYFYFVGSLHQRKNIINLIKGFNLFIDKTNSNIKLLIVGDPMWKNNYIKNIYDKLPNKDNIIFMGRKEINELTKISAAAIALTFIPYFEGFGIPIAEAISCHTPVITSNISCLPEIAGDTAVYVNPDDINEIANAMIELSSNNDKRNKLIENCKYRKDIFSWDRAAEDIWRVIDNKLKC